MIDKKILIIGQAPPNQPQKLPYDSTLLYEMLSWVGISIDEAQNIFDFDAVYDKFPGYNENGHARPTQEQMEEYWLSSLKDKIYCYKKILVLGSVAKKFLSTKINITHQEINNELLCLIHPSKLNYFRIMNNKDIITQQLNKFLK